LKGKFVSKTNMQRRGFLAGLGAVVAGGAAVLAIKPEDQAGEAVTVATAPEAAKGYRATEHVQKYYRTAKV
jgi:hypothetical protein